jgi:hypothetical protein
MHEVHAEATRFLYFAPDDPTDGAEYGGSRVKPLAPDLAGYYRGKDRRLVIFENPVNRRIGWFYALYWPGAIDLSALDHRVARGAYTDADFAPSVRTVFQQTHCAVCKRVWPTLVIPPGDPYPGAPGLLEHKGAAATYRSCPACRSSLRQLVVKIFDEPAR